MKIELQNQDFTLFHHSFEVLGGSERVAIAVLNVLKSLGFRVKLITLTSIDKDKIKKWDENFVEPDEIIIKKFPFKFGIYRALFLSLYTGLPNSFSTIGDITRSTYSYIHFPWSLTDNLKLIDDKYYKSEPYISNKKLRMYYIPYKYMHRLFLSKNKSKLLANSNWTRKILEISGYSATVLYPPVYFNSRKTINKKKDPNLIIYIGRISPEKNVNFIVDVAKRLNEFKFVIIGASGRDKEYINSIKRASESLDNLTLKLDATKDEIDKYLSVAKIYFHPKINEHFGISIVEAMASQLIPVIHKSGGAWYDIVEEGKYGIGYDSLETAIDAIKEASKMEIDFSDKIAQFSFNVFKEKLSRIIENGYY
ncbi:glycosyltransferase [Sulfuracidifex metallicus]|uniref:Glycosyltransferase n=2 Tax=Sulfuracidifex metallicus TaxID=47303 RepID=A0A6A9QHI4_SULME|nr:glycosyltransferase [Sulfuracidifex metallicus]MUN28466.1 glycosyltransferase [Sulfuracidifex metallicus DSM 6482 = JCM 9184]WOE51018.1 glycosyltransferase [Sulfuracidifex metallicus DSM 6482 = JCM 9184]